LHRPLKPGTFASILKNVAEHHRITVPDLLAKLGLG